MYPKLLLLVSIFAIYSCISQEQNTIYCLEDEIRYSTERIKSDPNDGLAYYDRALAKTKLQDYEGAKFLDYEGAKEDFEKAREIFTKEAIEQNIGKARAYNNRRRVKNSLKDYKGAIADFTKAIELDTTGYQVFDGIQGPYFHRGSAKFQLNDSCGACKDWAKAAELDRSLAVDKLDEHCKYYALIYHGKAKNELKKYADAIDDFTKAIKINADDSESYNHRGHAKNNLHDFKGGIKDLTKAIELNPNYAEAYYNRGYSKYQLNDHLGACKDWKKALELGNIDADEALYKKCK